jgi:hypothetical protein
MRGSPLAPVRALSTYSLSQPRHSMARMGSTRPCVHVVRSFNSPTRMAYDASSFNDDLNSERCKGPSLTRTVYGASSFNGDLNKWGVAKVTVQRTWFMVPCPSTVTSTVECCKSHSLARTAYGASSPQEGQLRCLLQGKRQGSEVGSAKSEARSRKSEVGSAKPEARSRKTGLSVQ